MAQGRRCGRQHRQKAWWPVLVLMCWAKLWTWSCQDMQAWMRPMWHAGSCSARRTMTRTRRRITLGAAASGASVDTAGASEDLSPVDMELPEDLVPDEDLGFVDWLLGELSFEFSDLAIALAAAVVAGVAIAFATAQDDPVPTEGSSADASTGEDAEESGKGEQQSPQAGTAAKRSDKYS
mmetsp:Transcript_14459/g.26626  ORF Transcript_14459/g.26626 Transcript_14459/m.26626 type:complete len:180 (+) Transcript_14459:55-594(+)